MFSKSILGLQAFLWAKVEVTVFIHWTGFSEDEIGQSQHEGRIYSGLQDTSGHKFQLISCNVQQHFPT
jgi:hypothetical protein